MAPVREPFLFVVVVSCCLIRASRDGCLFVQCRDYTVLGIVLAWFVSPRVQHFKCSAYGVSPLPAECLVFGTRFCFAFASFPFVCGSLDGFHNTGTL